MLNSKEFLTICEVEGPAHWFHSAAVSEDPGSIPGPVNAETNFSNCFGFECFGNNDYITNTHNVCDIVAVYDSYDISVLVTLGLGICR